jgi:hypothetical protein
MKNQRDTVPPVYVEIIVQLFLIIHKFSASRDARIQILVDR